MTRSEKAVLKWLLTGRFGSYHLFAKDEKNAISRLLKKDYITVNRKRYYWRVRTAYNNYSLTPKGMKKAVTMTKINDDRPPLRA